MKKVIFDVSTTDAKLIGKIIDRIRREAVRPIDGLEYSMDITACHANGTPLKLQKLLNAKRADFLHDVSGINRHIDRDTGKLPATFRPRYAI